ncbi:hypothetical protein [uncultured Nostoc sp.]|uniref:hypothetical protein n=1 Tax=uncultured Nostoc sp. TaxID=340711 RepID=UPI0035CC1ED0
MINVNEIKELAKDCGGEFRDYEYYYEISFLLDRRDCSCSSDSREFEEGLRALKIKNFFRDNKGNRKTKLFAIVIIRK